ncbi:hypothetical protein GQ600_20724 [Phytophthora cactorum]|nr:hypothetical protein GQ600_20724 [Phytophthora cactorum]
MKCRCTQCKQAAPYAAYPWRAKMLVCLDRKVVSLFECGEHVTRAIPPHSRNLTAPKKDFAKQMARAALQKVKKSCGATAAPSSGVVTRLPPSWQQSRG